MCETIVALVGKCDVERNRIRARELFQAQARTLNEDIVYLFVVCLRTNLSDPIILVTIFPVTVLTFPSSTIPHAFKLTQIDESYLDHLDNNKYICKRFRSIIEEIRSLFLSDSRNMHVSYHVAEYPLYRRNLVRIPDDANLPLVYRTSHTYQRHDTRWNQVQTAAIDGGRSKFGLGSVSV